MVVVNCKNGTPPLNAGGKTAPLGRFVCRWSAAPQGILAQKAAADIEIMAKRAGIGIYLQSIIGTRARSHNGFIPIMTREQTAARQEKHE
jgi:hypothetical protein